MYNLVIDRGNHSTKIYVYSSGEIIKVINTSDHLAPILAELLREYKISASILSTVLDDRRDIEVGLMWNNAHITLDAETELPITISYATPQSLGPDRIAAAVGGWQLFKPHPVLVVVAGTCITYNIVEADGRFVGGAISPGLNMRLKAMHEFTGKLPLVGVKGDYPLTANTTESSLRSGALNGAVREVGGMIASYGALYPNLKTVISGGDGAFLAEALKNGIFARPDLVAEGLYSILKFNVAESLTK